MQPPPTDRRDVRRSVIDVTVFGPTVVLCDGAPIDLGRRQVRQLVTILASRDDWFSADTLIDHVWAHELPANPRKALNVALSRLRSALGDDAHRVETTGAGYRLRVDRVDVGTFSDLVEQARSVTGGEAADLLGAALRLWVADPFADAADSLGLTGHRANLWELRRYAATRRVELLTEIGRAEEAVVVAAEIPDDGVVRERVVIAHAVALAQLGRKSEAIALTSTAIDRLRSEHGLVPSASLIDTEQRILTGSVDLIAGSTGRARPTAEVFVGREDELAILSKVAAGACRALVAEAGTGKSAVLDQLAGRFLAEGRSSLRIDVAATPERPLDTVARLCLGLIDRIDGLELRPEFHPAIGRICPELGFVGSAALTRDSLLDDLVRFIETHCTEVVLIVDDIHWVDGGSAAVLERLVDRGRVAIVAASRPSDDSRLGFLLGSRPTFGSSATREESAGRVEVIHLAPLTKGDVLALIESRSGRSIDDDFVQLLLEHSGGNGLFVRLLIDRWVEGESIDGDLPSSILVTVGERLDLLARAVVDTLQCAAAMGRSFRVQTLRQMRPNADADLLAAAHAGIVRIDDMGDVASFVHAVVGDSCYQLLAEGRRVSIHDEIAFVLESDGAPAAELARHHVASASLDPHRAIWTGIRAAGEFIVGFDWETALVHLDRAVALADEYLIDEPLIRAHIAVRRGTAGRAMWTPSYVEDLLEGCEYSRLAGEHELFVVAVTELCGHGHTTKAAVVDERVLVLLDEALGLPIDRAIRAELCAASASFFSTSNAAHRGRQLFREAWEISAELGDPQVEGAIVAHAHLGFSHPDDFELLVEASRRMSEIAGSDAEMIWEAAFVRFECSVIVGDAEGAQQAIDEMRLYAPRVVRRPRDFGLAFSESAHARLVGDLEAAQQHADRTLVFGLERFDESWAMTIFGLLLVGIRSEQGRLDELTDVIESMVEESPEYVPFHVVAAAVACVRGDALAVRSHLDVVSLTGLSPLVRDVHFTSLITLLAPAVAAHGTTAEIAALDEMLEPFAGRMSWNGASSDGPVDGALALLAVARGDVESAAALQQSADELAARFRQPALVVESLPVHTSRS